MNKQKGNKILCPLTSRTREQRREKQSPQLKPFFVAQTVVKVYRQFTSARVPDRKKDPINNFEDERFSGHIVETTRILGGTNDRKEE